jgi:hypothetical protein
MTSTTSLSTTSQLHHSESFAATLGQQLFHNFRVRHFDQFVQKVDCGWTLDRGREYSSLKETEKPLNNVYKSQRTRATASGYGFLAPPNDV